MNQIKVRICVGTNCCFRGGEMLIDSLGNDTDLGRFIEIEAVQCMGKLCRGGTASPLAEIDGRLIARATPELLMEEIEKSVTGQLAGIPKGASAEEASHA